MNRYIQTALDTSEVWALLIPLVFIAVKKPDTSSHKEVFTYLLVAFFLNLVIVTVTYFPDYYSMDELPFLLKNNTIEYNVHSIARVILFSLYFLRNSQPVYRLQKMIILVFFLAFVLLNFMFFESPIALFSSRLFTAEAVVLLYYCIFYFLSTIRQEKNEKLSSQPMFWFVTALCIYEAVNFFIFLLYTYLITNYTVFAQHIWNLHNVSYIIFCILLTIGFYEAKRK